MTQPVVKTKAQLLQEIEDHWRELNTYLDSLTASEMATRRDAAGWSAKDHLSHLMAWERSVLFLLQGKPRNRGLGVGEEAYQQLSEDEINAILFQRDRDRPLAKIRDEYDQVHQALLEAIGLVSDDNLQQPYERFLPDEVKGDGRTAMNVVYYNSANHYVEHLTWIRALIGS